MHLSLSTHLHSSPGQRLMAIDHTQKTHLKGHEIFYTQGLLAAIDYGERRAGQIEI